MVLERLVSWAGQDNEDLSFWRIACGSRYIDRMLWIYTLGTEGIIAQQWHGILCLVSSERLYNNHFGVPRRALYGSISL